MTLSGENYLAAVNKALVEKHFPHFRLYGYGGEPYFEGWLSTSSGKYRFQFRLYPRPLEEMPLLYIWNPSRLYKVDGGTVNSMGISHQFHTLSNAPGGQVQICHTRSEYWDPSCTWAHALFKASLWMEAYEWHRETGRPLCDFFDEDEW